MTDINYNNIFKKKKLFFSGVLIALLVAFFDLLTKELVFKILENKEWQMIEVLSFFNLVKVWNYGVSFGMFNDLENSKIIFSVIVSVISFILLIWLYKNESKYLMYAISFIIGGAIGNLADRIHNGGVADFLDFHAFGYHWPAFNLADSFVFIGVAMLIFEDLILKKKEK